MITVSYGHVYTILGLLGLLLIRDLLPSCPLALFVRARVVAKGALAATRAARALADAAVSSSFFRNFVGTSLARFAFPGVGSRYRWATTIAWGPMSMPPTT